MGERQRRAVDRRQVTCCACSGVHTVVRTQSSCIGWVVFNGAVVCPSVGTVQWVCKCAVRRQWQVRSTARPFAGRSVGRWSVAGRCRRFLEAMAEQENQHKAELEKKKQAKQAKKQAKKQAERQYGTMGSRRLTKGGRSSMAGRRSSR